MSRIIRSPEKQIRHKKKMRILFAVVFLCIGGLVWLVVWIPSLPSLQIKNIVVRGNKVLTEEEIKQKIESMLSVKYLGVFPETNVFLYPQKTLEDGLVSAFPRIATISTKLDTKRILTVTLTEREPFALWCGREVANATAEVSVGVSADDACSYLDDKGFVFSKAPHFSGNVYFEFYGKGLLPDGDPVGHEFLSPEIYWNILKIKERLENFQMKSVKIFVADDGGALITEAGEYGIRFNVDQDMGALESNMQAVFRSSSWGDTARSATFEYLDFRFGNKVYYKYKNQEVRVKSQE